MPRNGSGTYSLPAGNPVSSGTLIDSAWANSTLTDLASAMTDSLSRTGAGGMTAPLRFTDGSVSAPGIAWTNETSSGFYRAGASDFRVALNGVDVATVTSTGLTVVAGKTLAAQGNATVAGTLGVTGVLTATGGVSGNATTATTLQTARNINGVSFNGSANISVNTVNAVTFNNGGAGAASGTTFNGGSAVTVSYNTVGAPSTTGTNATGSWNINAATVTNGVYTTGDQNIAGSKRFSSSVVVGATGTAASTFDVQTTGANVLTSLFTTGLTDLNFRIGAMNGVAGGTTGTTQGKLGLFYLGTGEAATIDFRRGSTSTDASFAFRTSGSDRATLDNSGNFTATGNVTAYSDIRLKTDLQQIPDALAKVEQLTGYTYTRTDSGERQTGLVAQDVEKVLPEAVLQGQHLSLAYGNMVGLLVEAVKELSARVKELEAR